MKNYKTIAKEIKKNNEEIKNLESAADALLKTNERMMEQDFHKRMEISASISKDDEQKACELYSKAEELQQVNKILKENELASFADYASGIIKEILLQYANKPVGEKTREKIRAAAKEHGFSFYADYSGSFSASTLNNEGFFDYMIRDCHLSVCDNELHYASIYNKETGKLNDFSDLIIRHNYTYCDNPKKRVKDIRKAMQAYKTAYFKAYELQEEVNKLLPTGKSVNHMNAGYDSMFKF